MLLYSCFVRSSGRLASAQGRDFSRAWIRNSDPEHVPFFDPDRGRLVLLPTGTRTAHFGGGDLAPHQGVRAEAEAGQCPCSEIHHSNPDRNITRSVTSKERLPLRAASSITFDFHQKYSLVIILVDRKFV